MAVCCSWFTCYIQLIGHNRKLTQQSDHWLKLRDLARHALPQNICAGLPEQGPYWLKHQHYSTKAPDAGQSVCCLAQAGTAPAPATLSIVSTTIQSFCAPQLGTRAAGLHPTDLLHLRVGNHTTALGSQCEENVCAPQCDLPHPVHKGCPHPNLL